jgi:hypothetical protein
VLELVEPADKMIFNSLGESHVMRRKDHVHGDMMQSVRRKIQRKC